MAKAADRKHLERTYTIPLRKEYMKVARWKKTKKAVSAVREFLSKHMKSEDIKLGKALNEKLWQHGIRNPPHHVKVSVSKDEKGVVKAELFGVQKKEEDKKDSKKTTPKVEEKKVESKQEVHKKEEEKQEQAALEKETPVVKEEPLPKEKDEKATQATPSVKNQKY